MANFRKDIFKTCKDLWKELLAEFIGTLFLVLIGCGSTVGKYNERLTHLEIAVCFGVTVGVIAHIIGYISGGHINPAVTVGMVVALKMNVLKGILFILAQIVGGIAGAALLFLSLPTDLRESLGITKVNKDLNYGQAFEIEFFITLLLVFSVFMVFDPRKAETRKEPMIVGLVVTVCHIWAIKFTGSSMNPARSFGPALIGFDWDDHWVYWVGPILGGIVAALLYKFIFEPAGVPIEKYEPKIAEDIEAAIEEKETEEEISKKGVEKPINKEDVEKRASVEDKEKRASLENIEKPPESEIP